MQGFYNFFAAFKKCSTVRKYILQRETTTEEKQKNIFSLALDVEESMRFLNAELKLP